MRNELLSHITDSAHTHTHVPKGKIHLRLYVCAPARGDDCMICRLIAAGEAGGISSGSE